MTELDPTTRLVVAQLETDVITLRAIQSDLKENGLTTRHIENRLDGMDRTIRMVKDAN